MTSLSEYQIKNLDSLLFPSSKEPKIDEIEVKDLVKPGENYGSAIFAITIKLKSGKVLEAVAKMLPQNEFLQKLFKSEKTFRNEVGYYEKIIPALRNFQKQFISANNLINPSPECYAARFNLDNLESSKVDLDAVLLLHNLKTDGYRIGDQKVGFDLRESQTILAKLAELHATFRAMKLAKLPEEIEEFLETFRMYDDVGDPDTPFKMIENYLLLLMNDEFCVENLDTIRKCLINNVGFGYEKNSLDLLNSKFATFIHGDLWTNNILIKHSNTKEIDVKFIDLQIYEHSSLARDLFFFMYSSVELGTLQNHSDSLLQFYYDHFIDWMKKFNCDVSMYHFNDLINELKMVINRTELFHLMLMLKTMYIKEQHLRGIDNLEADDFHDNSQSVHEIFTQKTSFIFKDFIRRGWIS